MKYLILILLFVSCATKKTTLNRQTAELINVESRLELIHLKNTFLSDSLNISFRQIQYDTAGNVSKETTGNIIKLKTEIVRDTIIQKDTIFITQETEIKEEVRQEKKQESHWKWLIIVVCLGGMFYLLKIKK